MTFDINNARKLLETSDGKELARFIDAEIESLDSVSGIEVTTPTEIAVEVRARALAAEKLRDILGALILGQGSTEPSTEEESEYAM